MQPQNNHPLKTAVVALCCLVVVAGCSIGQLRPMPAELDLAAIKAADKAYVTAWLNNEPEQVMATLTDDAVLIPSGLPTLAGSHAIREFWWPVGSPSTNVTEFRLQQDEAGGDGNVGFVRGSFTLGFEYDGKSYLNAGNYVSLLRRQPDSSWQITHRIWTDHPAETN